MVRPNLEEHWPPLKFSEMKTTRDLVAASIERRFGDDTIMSAYPEAEDRLSKEARKRRRELRAVALDTNERVAVRVKAAELYTRAGGKRSLDVCVKLLTERRVALWQENVFDGALDLYLELEKRFPNEFDGICRKCLLAGGIGAQDAFSLLWNKGDLAFLAEHYVEIVACLPEMAPSILDSLLAKPCSSDTAAFINGVQSADFATAMLAAEGIRRRGLEDGLPQSARDALERWRQNPAFRVMLVSKMPDAAKRNAAAVQMLATISGTDCVAASAYGAALRVFTGDYLQGPITAEAAVCLDKLRECIRAYLDSSNKTDK